MNISIPIVRVTVGGSPIAADRIARRGPMSFGQNWRGVPVVEIPYTLALPTDAVAAALDALLVDYRADSEANPGPDDSLDTRWRAANWIAAREALRAPELALELVSFMATELLDAALRDPAPFDFLINTVDDVVVDGELLTLCGAAGVVAPMGRGGPPWHSLRAVLQSSRYIAQPHLVIELNGTSLDMLLAESTGDSDLAGLVTTLDGCLADPEERSTTRAQALPSDGERCYFPALVCPDDLDLSCTVVGVNVSRQGDWIIWTRFGLGLTGSGAESTEGPMEWLDGVGPFVFALGAYEQFLAQCRALESEWWDA